MILSFEESRLAFYSVLFRRRDVRAQFTSEPLEPEVLGRILTAAHSAPSVGMSQPWNFVVVTDLEIRTKFQSHVAQEREVFMDSLIPDEAERFAKIKIEGILESSLAVVVTYDPQRGSPAVLGRHAIADAGLYSVCLAIENLWLAATAEDIGVGWVSFYKEEFLSKLLNIPTGIRPVAWLCIGAVSHLEEVPDLERLNWQSRRPLAPLIYSNSFGDFEGVEEVVRLPTGQE